MRKGTIGALLDDYGLMSDYIKNINIHLEVLGQFVDLFKQYFPSLSEKNDEELATIIVDMIKKCDGLSPLYDPDIDRQMVRFGLGTGRYKGGHNSNKWYRETPFSDDYYGFGNAPTSIYDDFMDLSNEEMAKIGKHN